MQLNKKHREDFVRRVMADVPQIDYKTQADDLIRKELQALRNAAGLGDVDNERLSFTWATVHLWKHRETDVLSVPKPATWSSEHLIKDFARQGNYGLTHAEIAVVQKHQKLLEMRDKYIAQHNERLEMSKRVQAVIASCNTLKQAIEALPEFTKYLPKEVVKVDRQLPVVGNLVAELSKKGWPKK